MKLDMLKNNSKIILALLVVFSIFVGLGCISATGGDGNATCVNDTYTTPFDVNTPFHPASEPILDDNGTFVMSARGASGSTGYHWEISPETYGVDLVSQNFVEDHPGAVGSSGTTYFTFHVNGDSYYVKLLLVTPHGDVVKELDSNMLN